MLNVFILKHRLGGVVVFWLIPGGSVCLIPAVAVSLLVIHATEMEGGGGGVDGDFSRSAGGLIPGGVTVLKNTRGVVARIRGEPTVPGMIPGGVASRPIPGGVVRTLGWELVFPGMIPGGVASRLLLFIAGHLLFIAGGRLFTQATSRRRGLGCPVNSRRAVATAFALLTSRLGWRLVLLLSGFLLQI